MADLSKAITDDFKTSKPGLCKALTHHASELRSKWKEIEVDEFFNRLAAGFTGSMILFVTKKDKRVLPGLGGMKFVTTADEWIANSQKVDRTNSTMGVCGR